MAIRTIIQTDDPRLSASNQNIMDTKSPAITTLIADLTDTMRHKDLVGIAAPQIGENYQVFLTEIRETKFRPKDQLDILRVYINPKIIWTSSETVSIYEGCGSVKQIDAFGPVMRPKEVKVEALNEKGEIFQLECDGLLARVIQHEIDHLKGLTFADHIQDPSTILTFSEYQEFKKNSKELAEASKITKIHVI